MARKLALPSRSTVLDVLGAAGISGGLGAVADNYFGLIVGAGVFAFTLGALRAAVTIWNASTPTIVDRNADQ